EHSSGAAKELMGHQMAGLIQERALHDELLRIIRDKKIVPVFQPIVSLKDGEIMGYEALARGPSDSPLHMPAQLFSVAVKHKMLLALEHICREVSIQQTQMLAPGQQLFLNVTPEVINDPEFRNGRTKQVVLHHGLIPEQITFEITERTAISDFGNFTRALHHYRTQGYCIAVDDAGAGYSSLQAIAELYPDFIKLDMSIVRDIHNNPFKIAILEALVNLASAMNSKIIAEGVETMDELLTVMKLGVGYAQGFFFARPSNPPAQIAEEALDVIRKFRKKEAGRRAKEVGTSLGRVIGDIIEHVPTVNPETTTEQVEDRFAASSVRGVVVLQGSKPVGLVMKNRLYFHLGSYYGVSLYHKRPVELVMDTSPLIVNAELPLEAVSKIAMSREESNLYDLIIVVQEGQYVGVVSIMNLLNNITQLQVLCAHNSNPLTGLPGNLMIEEQLRRLLATAADFAVLYIDLNNFKAYNDKYGFERGDQVLLMTSETLSRSLASEGQGDDFLGHIGGDDFLIITSPDRAERVAAAIIELFDQEIRSAFSAEDLKRGCIQVKNRRGIMEKFPVTSISVAGVTNKYRDFKNYWEIPEVAAELKKAAKQQSGSCFVFDRRKNTK
ncbi:MAG TPA: GGDEF domain-containing protein, partial [Negativicutes bacterium]|nr:GGDEF domain-containing protein [Negativicutes bacterium]